MKNRIFSLLFLVSIFLYNFSNAQTTGKLLNLNIQAPSLANNLLGTSTTQPIAIYVPPSYDISNKNFPVVYFLGGYGDRVSDWTSGTYQNFRIKEVMDKLISNKTVNEFIVVIICGYNFLGGSFYVNSPVSGKWEDFVIKDVIEYIDTNFRTIKNREARGLGGHSMGGFGTINLAMLHPEIFGSVYALSPGLYNDNGLKTSQLFKSDAFINQFIQKIQELNEMSSSEAMNSYKSYISSRFSSGDWDTPFGYAYGSAFSPDTAKSVPYINYPYAKSDDLFLVDSLILKNYDSGFGRQLEKVKKYKQNFLSLKLFEFEVGTYDEYPWLRNGCDYFDKVLTDEGIEHQFTRFSGGHQDKVGERFEKYLLPALSAVLLYDTSATVIKTGEIISPENFDLSNFPNPFNPETTFHFYNAKTSLIKMNIYNILGKKIKCLIHEIKSPGEYAVKWKAENLPSGVYFCRLENDKFSVTKKVILQK
jgi:S-formylglutathione hydrolase